MIVANRHNDPTLAAIKILELFVPVFLMLTGTNEQTEGKKHKSQDRLKIFKNDQTLTGNVVQNHHFKP